MSDGQTGLVVLFFVLVALGLAVVGLYYLGAFPVFREWWERFKAREAARAARAQEAQITRARGYEVSLSPDGALSEAIEVMARRGYPLQSRTENTVTFERSAQPDACLGCFLAILFLLPALIYMLAVAGKTVRTTLAAYPSEGGGSRLVVGGDDGQGVRELIQWAESLPVETEEEPPELPPVEPSGERTLASKLRELTELKEAGLITPDEFEAKRKELLDKM